VDLRGEGVITASFNDGTYTVSYSIDGHEPQNENMSEEQLAECELVWEAPRTRKNYRKYTTGSRIRKVRDSCVWFG
jgi:hypothetical protein